MTLTPTPHLLSLRVIVLCSARRKEFKDLCERDWWKERQWESVYPLVTVRYKGKMTPRLAWESISLYTWRWSLDSWNLTKNPHYFNRTQFFFFGLPVLIRSFEQKKKKMCTIWREWDGKDRERRLTSKAQSWMRRNLFASLGLSVSEIGFFC